MVRDVATSYHLISNYVTKLPGRVFDSDVDAVIISIQKHQVRAVLIGHLSWVEFVVLMQVVPNVIQLPSPDA